VQSAAAFPFATVIPASARWFVEILEPFLGPAYGSGGMFVLGARLVAEHQRHGTSRRSTRPDASDARSSEPVLSGYPFGHPTVGAPRVGRWLARILRRDANRGATEVRVLGRA